MKQKKKHFIAPSHEKTTKYKQKICAQAIIKAMYLFQLITFVMKKWDNAWIFKRYYARRAGICLGVFMFVFALSFLLFGDKREAGNANVFLAVSFELINEFNDVKLFHRSVRSFCNNVGETCQGNVFSPSAGVFILPCF